MMLLKLRTKPLAAACAVLSILTLTAACNRGTAEPAAESGESATQTVKMAAVLRNFTNPYWSAMRDGLEDEAKKQGVTVDIQAGAGETDVDGVNAKISTMANQDYNCFGVVPNNATNVITPLVPVARKKVPIMNLDTKADWDAADKAGVTFATFIGSDNEEAGKLAGERMVELTGGGGGKAAILQGLAGEANGIAREKGFRGAVGSDLDVVAVQSADYEQGKALTVTEAILKQHPDLKAIFAANDSMGLGAAKAVENAGLKGEVSIISVDGVQAALDAVESGSLAGTVTQYPYAEGVIAIDACIAAVRGTAIPDRVVAPIALIDKDNVSKAKESFPRPFEPFTNPIESLIK